MADETPFTLQAVPLPENLGDTLDDGTTSRGSLSFGDFEELVGAEIMVVGANAATPFTLVEGQEKPKSRYPGQKRMPFSLILRAPDAATVAGLHFDLRHPRLGLIPYVMLTRTLAYPDQPLGAYYEIAFV